MGHVDNSGGKFDGVLASTRTSKGRSWWKTRADSGFKEECLVGN